MSKDKLPNAYINIFKKLNQKKITFDFTYLDNIKYASTMKPTKEEIFQIIEKLLNIETID
jgi:hypothetical protein